MKIVSYVLAALFILVAALQYNDPDPAYWIVLYAGAGLVMLGKGLGRSSQFWTAIVIGAALAGILWTGHGFFDYLQSGNYGSIFGDMSGPAFVEETREFLGLVIVVAALWYFRKAR